LEASNALLLTVVEAYVDGRRCREEQLGTSAPHDLQPLCHDAELWRNGGRERKVSSLNVAIVSAEGGASSLFFSWVASTERHLLVDPHAAIF
jgi:hypothetical protein